jgi:hypothetical protein
MRRRTCDAFEILKRRSFGGLREKVETALRARIAAAHSEQAKLKELAEVGGFQIIQLRLGLDAACGRAGLWQSKNAELA